MTFLNFALVGGVAALSIQIIIHLFHKSRFQVVKWGAMHLLVGRTLRRYRPSARLLSLGLAVGNLILFPFGTGLGAYACWVLLKDEGRALFEG